MLFISEETMGSRWPRCCAISGVVVAIIGAVLAATFPLAYHAILNYVSRPISISFLLLFTLVFIVIVSQGNAFQFSL